jgi:hypothetical protein
MIRLRPRDALFPTDSGRSSTRRPRCASADAETPSCSPAGPWQSSAPAPARPMAPRSHGCSAGELAPRLDLLGHFHSRTCLGFVSP